MAGKIAWGAVLFAVGFFWSYGFLRQLLCQFTAALPIMRRLTRAGILDRENPRRFLTITIIVWAVLCLVIGFLIVWFTRNYLHLLLGFSLGAAVGFVLYVTHLGPNEEDNFRSFLQGYCRFIPDDTLRNAAYKGDTDTIRAALEEKQS